MRDPEFFTPVGCVAIGEFLRRDRRIKVVTLSGNSITDEGRQPPGGSAGCPPVSLPCLPELARDVLLGVATMFCRPCPVVAL
jgi:hypothetical protein